VEEALVDSASHNFLPMKHLIRTTKKLPQEILKKKSKSRVCYTYITFKNSVLKHQICPTKVNDT
jgi:hypothetical protein